MSDKLVTRNKISVGGGGGLHDRIKQAESKKQEAGADPKALPNRIPLIIDLSGSMDSPDGTKETKLELLKEGVKTFALMSNPEDTAVAVESFPAGFRIELTNDGTSIYMRMLTAKVLGNTPMGEGLSNTLEYHSPTRALLISDGEQTDGAAAFSEAQRFKQREVVVDTFHIGTSKSGEETLKKIAEITGGKYFKFTNITNFTENLHHFLPGARETLLALPESVQKQILGASETK